MRITPDWDPPDGGPPELEPASPTSSPLLEISNAVVRLYKAAFGRGPTHARTRFAGADTLVVVLQETMTISEHKLAALGEHERVMQHRLLLHQALEPELRAAVQLILDRPTLGLISGIDPHRDLAAEVITLAPTPIPIAGPDAPQDLRSHDTSPPDRRTRASAPGFQQPQPDLADGRIRGHDVP